MEYIKCINSISTLNICEYERKAGQIMIQIDYQDKRPLYEQIIEKFQNLIVRGILTGDSKLPSVRNLAIDLSINPNTIQRAYQELERMGFIYTVKGRGNFVSSDTSWKRNEKENNIKELNTILVKLKELGITQKEIADLVKDIYSKEGQQ